MIGRKGAIGAVGSKSALLSVNRLLDPGGVGYASPSKGTPTAKAVGGAPIRRRHTTEDGPRSASMSFARRGSSKAEVLEPVEEAQPPKKEAKDTTDALACQLALRHRLMLSEVKCIIREFLKAPRNAVGGLAQEDFDVVMARIFDVPAINKQVSKNAYVEASIDKGLNIEKFLAWYVQNMFTSVNALTADHAMASSNALAYSVAAKCNVSNSAIEKIKVKFDHYDLDNSGKIEYPEFVAMFMDILKVKDEVDLNPDRMKRFWSQVDKNGDGGIDFEEFATWYLKYFSSDTDQDATGPLQKFYDGFNPSVQRRLNLEATQKKSQTWGG